MRFLKTPLFLCCLLVPCLGQTPSPTSAPAPYRIVDLGTLGGEESIANGINNRGEIVGYSDIKGRGYHAFLWKQGKMQDLGALEGYSRTEARAINEAGHMAGVAISSGEGSPRQPVMWVDGKIVEIKLVDGNGCYAINNRGQILGSGNRCFLWENGKVTYFDKSLYLSSINDRGKIVGTLRTDEGADHAFLWEKGKVRDLGTFGGLESSASSITWNGKIYGEKTIRKGATPADKYRSVFCWQNSKITDLGSFADGSGYVRGANSTGQVVGEGRDREKKDHGYLYDRGKWTCLDDLIPKNEDWDLQTVAAINEHGAIVGMGMYKGKMRAYLLKPIPQSKR